MAVIQDATAIVLAAGKGTRMDFDGPKVLALLNGKPILVWVIESLEAAGIADTIVVLGHRKDEIGKWLNKNGKKVRVVGQVEQLGTAHAVSSAIDSVPDTTKTVLVAYGDKPLVSPRTLRALIHKQQETGASVVLSVAHFPSDDTGGYGRIKRDALGKIMGIVEQKLCSGRERYIGECNAGFVAYDANWLRQALPQVSQNEIGEYFLTDLVEIAYREYRPVEVIEIGDLTEAHGINTKEHLKQASFFASARIR